MFAVNVSVSQVRHFSVSKARAQEGVQQQPVIFFLFILRTILFLLGMRSVIS